MLKTSRSAIASRWRASLVAAGLAGAVSVGFVNQALAADPIKPEGIWYTKDDESIIKVTPCAQTPDAFCGSLVWLKEPKETDGTPKVDKLNKDPAEQGKPMIGLEILRDMKADDDHWTGKAYNPDDGKFYDITFKVKTDKEENDQADLRGCILRFLCQTETFNRAKDVPGGDPTAADATPTPGKKKKTAKNSVKKEATHP